MRTLAAAGLACALLSSAAAKERYPFQNPALPDAARVQDFVARLTLEEKISLLSGEDNWHLPDIARLGVRGLIMTDGPAGLRSFQSEPSTAFPVGAAAGATWDAGLIRREGQAIGEETLGHGVDLILGPMVNLARVPVAGRNFETFAEDPVLGSTLAASYVEGVQSTGAGAVLKHYAANNQENGRNSGDSVVSERALREVYLSAFGPVVENAKPWAIMTAYPHVNGVFASENPFLLKEVLRRDWGFRGVVMSDWTGTHSTAPAMNAGLDLEMPGPAVWFGWKLQQAVAQGQVPVARIDEAVGNIAALMLKAKLFDPDGRKTGALNTEAHRDVAERVAEESIVLLKNRDGLLPLDAAKVRTVAIIGEPADRPIFQGGGSSQVVPYRVVTPLEALQQRYGARVEFVYAQGFDNEPHVPAVDPRLLSPSAARGEIGLHAVYYNDADFKGGVAFERTDNYFLKFGFGGKANAVDWTKMPQGLEAAYQTRQNGTYQQALWNAGIGFSVKWTGLFFAPKDGTYQFSLVHGDTARLVFDGKTLLDDTAPKYPSPIFKFFPSLSERHAEATLKAGQSYPLEIDFSATPTSEINYDQKVFQFGVRLPRPDAAEAIAAAKSADAVIVFAGAGSTAEAEGEDRSSIDFDPAQTALIEAVAAANPRTAVVVNEGAAVTMPWDGKVPAILDAWLPGQEGGTAIAKILFGDANPSGHLPITLPKRIEDSPSHLMYSGGAHQVYNEDVFVGYRYYDKLGIAPAYPFGHGLSYTSFAFSDLKAPSSVKPGDPVAVSLKVANSGAREGSAVVQLYLRNDAAPVPMPLKALKAFTRVTLKPGETRSVRLTLSPRDLSYWDDQEHAWVEAPGSYTVMAGASVEDIRASAPLAVGAK
ncbi:MAG TPA: glycoside hydrolase family 3 C-terminal domain-containing protein [Rhizomicrobium sp.]|nr:glycoside hydrolase family 3 C-terminal domain-containing protein [Rhizomicrobium sp.]